jgi:hypothetical protein
MQKEDKIIGQLFDKAKELIPIEDLEFNIELEKPDKRKFMSDLLIHVRYNEISFEMAGEVVSQSSSSILKAKIGALKSYISHDKNLLPIIIAEYLSPERREQCRKQGIFYIDLSGNIFIRHKGVYVDRSGFPNLYPEKRKGRGVFSDKASIIFREAFKDINKQWRIRELARSIGLDAGFVSRMIKELENRNYVSRKDSKLKLLDPDNILRDWAHEYDYRKNIQFKYFALSKSSDEIINKIKKISVPDNIKYALGFHSGANLISPYAVYHEVHIYINNMNDLKWFEKELELRKVEEGTNVIFLLPFYKNSLFYAMQKVDSLNVVSDIQLYLDLYKYPIRGIEQAEHIYESRLKKLLRGQ